MKSIIVLADGFPVTPDHKEIDPATGMQRGYVVLTPEERAKGFIRPYRDSYKHVGVRPKYPTRSLTEDEHERYDKYKYVAFEPYPEGSPESNGGSSSGRFWTDAQLHSGCGQVTTMGAAIAETFARDPGFYGGTFCAPCRTHYPLNEFLWEGTAEQVGS